jgi:triosephosphate isomerase
MLADISVDLVELGHSERRAYFNETDFTVKKKDLAALAHNPTPIIYVGKNNDENVCSTTKDVAGRQVRIALHGVDALTCERVWIAFERIWAVGVGGVP